MTTAPTPAPLDDADAFAAALFSAVAAGTDGDPRIINPPQAEYHEFKAAIAAARALHPDGTGPEHPVELADEAAHAWAGESYHRGIAFGVAAERFRCRILAAAD